VVNHESPVDFAIEAALYYLEKAGVRRALSRAIWAAYERSVQLGMGKKCGPVGDD
jgi:pyrroline-5-carboxylate reductase